MNLAGKIVCVILGGTGATVGYFLPVDASTGAVFAILAVAFGAADLVIQSSLKLIDDRIKQEIGKVKTAYRVVIPLTRTRQGLLDMNLVAMTCKGLTVATGAMAISGKAPSWVLAVGGGAFGLGVTLTSVIWISHKHLVTRANEDALTVAEESNAADAVQRLGNIDEAVDLPKRKTVRLAEDKTAANRKPKKSGK